MTFDERIGCKLMFGVPGPRITPEIVRIFQKTRAAGLIVFRPNFASAAAFKKLLRDLEEALGRRLLVAVDHEGGRVIHLAAGVSVFPDNRALAETGREEFARRQGSIEAAELRALGIDLNLAPALDVLAGGFSPNIGIRSYGSDPDLVTKLGVARIRAMQAGGLSACAKHFPGQGQSPLDAHLDLPVLFTPRREMERLHLPPFRAALKAGVDAVMSSHPIYPNLERERIPATFSRAIIHGLLRIDMGFKGLILSDDLEMGALKGLCPIGESAVRAVQAGHDMVLVCHDPAAQLEAHRALLEAYQSGRLDEGDLDRSFERVRAFLAKRPERFASLRPSPGEGKALAARIAREGVKVSSSPAFKRPRKDRDLKAFVIFPKLSTLRKRIYIEHELLDERVFIRNLFRENKILLQKIELLDFEPARPEIEKVSRIAKRSELTVFFCYDAHLYPGMRECLEKVQAGPGRCAVVLLRDPYDEAFVKPGSFCIQAWGFRGVQIKAAIEKISGWVHAG